MLKTCICGGRAVIRNGESSGGLFSVWVECSRCGRRTQTYTDRVLSSERTAGGKFAALEWNSTQREQERTA